MTITRTDLLNVHDALAAQAKEIMVKKNQDYAHNEDPFRNFRMFGGLGILVRMSDKLARLRSFEENNYFAVEDEKLLDTILDLLNYAIIYYSYKQTEISPSGITPGNVTTFGLLPPNGTKGDTYTLKLPDTWIVNGPHCDRNCGNRADFADDLAATPTSVTPQSVTTFGSLTVSTPFPIPDGPYCDQNCGNLADFADDNGGIGRTYWCANCACEQNVDTSDMTVLEGI